MLSGFFHKSTNLRINGGNFNQVQRDQYNYTTIVQAKEEELTEFDEYYKVKRGALLKLKDIGYSMYPRRWDDRDRKQWEEGEPRADRTICTARVLTQPGMVFTVVQYSGPDARRAFEDDFRMLSRILTSTVSQIYGHSRSEIPSLIFYNELIPAAHLGVGQLGRIYLRCIGRQLGCETFTEKLWLDCGRGVFCRGPTGPTLGFLLGSFGPIGDLPLTTDFLQEDVLLRFLASLKLKGVDDLVVRHSVSGGFQKTSRGMPEQVSQPTVILTLTNTPIAVAKNAWRCNCSCLSDGKLLKNGLTRYTLTGPPWGIQLWWNDCPDKAWMSQAWNIFEAHGISLEDDLSVYELFYPCARLESIQTIPNLKSFEEQHEQQVQQPIYLYIRQPPSDLSNYKTTSSLHYWSFHEDGCLPISHEICHSLGLPIELNFGNYCESFSWPSVAYRHIREYQLLRGFNPSTTDFVRHLGFDIALRPVNDPDRFEIQEESPPENQASTPTSYMSGIEELGPVLPTSVSLVSEIQDEHTSYESPFFHESFSTISTESVSMAENFDMEVD